MELVTGVFAILIQKASCESVGVERLPVFKGSFPDPEQQAEALLEICQGDVDEAQGIAATNLKFARSWDDGIYWLRVEGLLETRAGRDFGKTGKGKTETRHTTEVEGEHWLNEENCGSRRSRSQLGPSRQIGFPLHRGTPPARLGVETGKTLRPV